MKTAEIKTTSSSPQKKSQPFFHKKEGNSFFSNNYAEASFFSKSQPERSTVQAKLTIGQPEDKYEVEADTMADNVVQRLSTPDPFTQEECQIQTKPLAASITPLVQAKCSACEQEEEIQKKEEDDREKDSALELQRKCAACEDEEKIQKKEVDEEEKLIQEKSESLPKINLKNDLVNNDVATLQKKNNSGSVDQGISHVHSPNDVVPMNPVTSSIQLKCNACEKEEKLQKKEDDQEDPEPAAIHLKATDTPPNQASEAVESGINSTKGSGNMMPEHVRTQMESSFGADLSDIRIHSDSNAAQMNKELHSHAFTQGSDIYFNSGKYDYQSSSGIHLLAHELTHTLQQGDSGVRKKDQYANRGPIVSPLTRRNTGMVLTKSIQRFSPDEEKFYSGIDVSKAVRLNSFYWHHYKLAEIKPLRENTPDVTPVTYANRTFDAQKIMKPKLALYGKKIWVDGILGIETMVFLRQVATDESLVDIRFHIAGLGFDLDKLASKKGYDIARQAEVDLLPVDFVHQWNILGPGEIVMERKEETKDTDWEDAIIFGTKKKPVHLTKDNFSVAERTLILKLIYKDVSLTGRAAIVQARRDHIDQQKDGHRLGMQDPDRKIGNTQWVTFGADNKAHANQLDKWFNPEYPPKAAKLRDAVGVAEVGQKRKLTGLLMVFYIPEMTSGERARIDIIVQQHFKDKEENIENFINPKMASLIALLDDEDQKLFLLGFSIKEQLSAFFAHAKVFERMATLLEKHADKNYFELLIKKTLHTKNIGALEILLQLCFQTRFKDYPSVTKALEILDGLKQNIQSHDYLTGEKKEEQGVWLDKKRDDDHFLKVGDVTTGIYRIEENREQLKEGKRKQLQDKMTELINVHVANALNADEPAPQQQDMTQEKFMEMILEKAAQEVKISEDDIEHVLYEQAFRLKGVKKVNFEGVDEIFVDYERVARAGGKGEWEVTEASPGMRRRLDFENDLGWYKFHNMMETLETIVAVEVIIIGGAVLLFTGAGSALVALAGGGKVVAISIGISVLIYALTAEHFTIEGFLKAVLEGYLMALGFRFFTPLGGGIAKLIGTATFKQKLIGLILKSIVAGGGSGAFTNVGAMLVEDILRGKLRSAEAYLKGASVGFLLGAMFDLGGSLILGPAFRAAGRNVLERIANIQQLKEFIKKSGIILKPAQWGPEVSKNFVKFVQWINETLDSSIGSKIIAETKNKAATFLKSFGEGFELNVHRQALDLIEVGMTREAVDGLEKLIISTRSRLGNKAARELVDKVLNQLVTKPDRVNPFFALLKAADDDVMAALSRDKNFLDLLSSDAIFSLAAVRAPGELTNLFKLQFSNKVVDFESWARGLLAQDAVAQKHILDILESRGASVTPESLLRISQSGAVLTEEVVEGLSRLVRKSRAAGTLDKLDEMLKLFPDDKMEGFFKTVRNLPEKSFDDVIKLLDDPAQASRLLKYADDADQLARLLEASGNKPAQLDQLFGLTKGKTKAPQELESLLGRYGNDIDKVTNLVKQVDGDAALLERSIARMSRADVDNILAKGLDHNVTKSDPASMRRFLEMSEKNSWADAGKIKGFIEKIHSNQAQTFKHTFKDALDRLDDFVKHHSKSSAPPPVLAGHGPLNLAAKDSFVEITLFDGTAAKTTVTAHSNAKNLQHYKERHTFDNFWFDPPLIDRAGASTLWRPGTADDIILKDLMEVLNKPAIKTIVEAAHPSNFARSQPPHLATADGTSFQIGINLPVADVSMFFPNAGPRAFKVSKYILHGVKDLLGL